MIAFLYADLIVLPLLDTYRRFFGWRFAAYLGGVFFVTMVIAAMLVDLAFSALGLVPERGGDVTAHLTHFAINYTFFLNIAAAVLAGWLILRRRADGDVHRHHHHHATSGS